MSDRPLLDIAERAPAAECVVVANARKKRASGSGPAIENRNEVYRNVKSTFTRREAMVLETIRKLGNATMHEVAEALKVEVNQISGRFKPLHDKGAIVADGKRQTKTGSLATVWKEK